MFDLDIDDSELNLNKDDDEETSLSSDKPVKDSKETKRPGRPGRPVRGASKSKGNNENKASGLNFTDNKMLYLIGGVVGVSVLVGGFMLFSNSQNKKELLAQQEKLEYAQQQQQLQQQQLENDRNKVSTGIPSLYGTGSTENNSPITDSSEILKDLNGNPVDSNYNVVRNETVTDFINYKKYRATTGNGLEFYWLEAKYKGGDYKVQVPYSIYSKLDSEGITVVDAEVLTLDNGSEIVTYMSVRKDAKALLER